MLVARRRAKRGEKGATPALADSGVGGASTCKALIIKARSAKLNLVCGWGRRDGCALVGGVGRLGVACAVCGNERWHDEKLPSLLLCGEVVDVLG